MHTFIRNTTICALTVAVMPLAHATDLGTASRPNQADTVKPWMVRFGYNGLTATTGRDLTNQDGFELGLGRSLGQVGLLGVGSESWAELIVSVNRGNNSGVSDRFGAFFIERKGFDVTNSDRGFYAGYGLGLAIARVEGNYGTPLAGTTVGPFRADQTQLTLQGRILAGYKFNPITSAELALNFGPKIDGVSTDSVSLTVGIRF